MLKNVLYNLFICIKLYILSIGVDIVSYDVTRMLCFSNRCDIAKSAQWSVN